MGTITGQQIADRAWIKVNEGTGSSATRWTPAEALLWINDGQRECVNQVPSSNAKRATPTLELGSSRQTLAGLGLSDGVSIIDIQCNYNIAGTTRGRSITKRQRSWFDDERPTWRATPAQDNQAVHWMHDERDPTAFDIFPQPASASKVEIIYAALPVDLPTLASAISLNDIYANALQAFLLFSFYSKDSTYTKNQATAQAYWALFQQLLGIRATNLDGNDKVGTAAAAGVTA